MLGNNDFNEYGTRVDRFARPVIDGVRLLVAHYPHEVRWGFAGGGESAPGDSIPDICIHGHTHVPELLSGASARPAAYVLCPGSVSFPRSGSQRSIAYIEVKDARILEVRIARKVAPLSPALGRGRRATFVDVIIDGSA